MTSSSVEVLTDGFSRAPVLTVDELMVHFAVPGVTEPLRAVDGVSFSVGPRETFGLIGESGSGKSTVARAIMGLSQIKSGTVKVSANSEQPRSKRRRRRYRGTQMIFQDPHESLNPRMRALSAVAEPLRVAGVGRAESHRRAADLIQRVALDQSIQDRRPAEMSGGQKQRLNIARALALEPGLLICDEAVSALDLSIQSGILNLLVNLQKEFRLSMLFISHDIGVVTHIADRVGVMYLGKLVEIRDAAGLEHSPRHPYSEALLAAEPQALPSTHREERAPLVEGDLPSPLDAPSGCRFRTRCRYATDRCASDVPELRELDGGLVACHYAENLTLKGRRA